MATDHKVFCPVYIGLHSDTCLVPGQLAVRCRNEAESIPQLRKVVSKTKGPHVKMCADWGDENAKGEKHFRFHLRGA